MVSEWHLRHQIFAEAKIIDAKLVEHALGSKVTALLLNDKVGTTLIKYQEFAAVSAARLVECLADAAGVGRTLM